ncbi:MAG TPA: prolipoprotein diacylglyceryl transferase family protein, partial [Phnomibacter sp.]|nr:prolipoprotein diacylglyceryl transferase family protein [Phnomibacter sp.]
MYPNLYFFFKQVFGVELAGLKLINSFGLMVAFAFIAAAIALTSELRRREAMGWLRFTEAQIDVGKGADLSEVMWNAFFGFLLGWKVIGLLLNRQEALQDPQSFILSGQGNLAAGILLALVMGGYKWYSGNKTKLAKPEKRKIRIWPHERVGDMIIMAALFGFGGAKIFHNLENWDDLVADPIGSLLSFSGLTFYGGLICAGAAIIWYSRRHKIDLWHLTDSFGPALMLAYAIGRIGCQVAGDGDWGILNSAYVANEQGKAVLATGSAYTDTVSHYLAYYQQSFAGVKEIKAVEDVMHAPFKAPGWLPTWMVAYTYPNNVLSDGIPLSGCEGQWCRYLPNPVYPTPFYETIMGLIIFALLWSARKKLTAPGALFGMYLFFTGLERFLIEKIRVNTTYKLGFWEPTQAEIISLILMAAGVAIY